MSCQIKLQPQQPIHSKSGGDNQADVLSQVWNRGSWSEEETAKCIVFFEFNRSQLHSKLKIKQNKFYKQMSMFIHTRNPIQCRSQSHKLLKKHKTFYNIVADFKARFSPQYYRRSYATFVQNELICFKQPEPTIQVHPRMVEHNEQGMQTQRSYLLKAYLKNIKGKREEKRGQEQKDYPFLKSGWWM